MLHNNREHCRCLKTFTQSYLQRLSKKDCTKREKRTDFFTRFSDLIHHERECCRNVIHSYDGKSGMDSLHKKREKYKYVCEVQRLFAQTMQMGTDSLIHFTQYVKSFLDLLHMEREMDRYPKAFYSFLYGCTVREKWAIFRYVVLIVII